MEIGKLYTLPGKTGVYLFEGLSPLHDMHGDFCWNNLKMRRVKRQGVGAVSLVKEGTPGIKPVGGDAS